MGLRSTRVGVYLILELLLIMIVFIYMHHNGLSRVNV